MKTLFAIIMMMGYFTFHTQAQEAIEQATQMRARELFRVIGLDDKEQWKKFIRENYTQALIDKPMKQNVTTTEDSNSTTATTQLDGKDKIEAKAQMFQRLHDDFAGSKLVSVKSTVEKVQMVIQIPGGLKGTFNLTFSKDKPYLMDGVSIEINGEN